MNRSVLACHPRNAAGSNILANDNTIPVNNSLLCYIIKRCRPMVPIGILGYIKRQVIIVEIK